jgi:hypothetical protein
VKPGPSLLLMVSAEQRQQWFPRFAQLLQSRALLPYWSVLFQRLITRRDPRRITDLNPNPRFGSGSAIATIFPSQGCGILSRHVVVCSLYGGRPRPPSSSNPDAFESLYEREGAGNESLARQVSRELSGGRSALASPMRRSSATELCF